MARRWPWQNRGTTGEVVAASAETAPERAQRESEPPNEPPASSAAALQRSADAPAPPTPRPPASEQDRAELRDGPGSGIADLDSMLVLGRGSGLDQMSVSLRESMATTDRVQDSSVSAEVMRSLDNFASSPEDDLSNLASSLPSLMSFSDPQAIIDGRSLDQPLGKRATTPVAAEPGLATLARLEKFVPQRSSPGGVPPARSLNASAGGPAGDLQRALSNLEPFRSPNASANDTSATSRRPAPALPIDVPVTRREVRRLTDAVSHEAPNLPPRPTGTPFVARSVPADAPVSVPPPPMAMTPGMTRTETEPPTTAPAGRNGPALPRPPGESAPTTLPPARTEPAPGVVPASAAPPASISRAVEPPTTLQPAAAPDISSPSPDDASAPPLVMRRADPTPAVPPVQPGSAPTAPAPFVGPPTVPDVASLPDFAAGEEIAASVSSPNASAPDAPEARSASGPAHDPATNAAPDAPLATAPTRVAPESAPPVAETPLDMPFAPPDRHVEANPTGGGSSVVARSVAPTTPPPTDPSAEAAPSISPSPVVARSVAPTTAPSTSPPSGPNPPSTTGSVESRPAQPPAEAQIAPPNPTGTSRGASASAAAPSTRSTPPVTPTPPATTVGVGETSVPDAVQRHADGASTPGQVSSTAGPGNSRENASAATPAALDVGTTTVPVEVPAESGFPALEMELSTAAGTSSAEPTTLQSTTAGFIARTPEAAPQAPELSTPTRSDTTELPFNPERNAPLAASAPTSAPNAPPVVPIPPIAQRAVSPLAGNDPERSAVTPTAGAPTGRVSAEPPVAPSSVIAATPGLIARATDEAQPYVPLDLELSRDQPQPGLPADADSPSAPTAFSPDALPPRDAPIAATPADPVQRSDGSAEQAPSVEAPTPETAVTPIQAVAGPANPPSLDFASPARPLPATPERTAAYGPPPPAAPPTTVSRTVEGTAPTAPTGASIPPANAAPSGVMSTNIPAFAPAVAATTPAAPSFEPPPVQRAVDVEQAAVRAPQPAEMPFRKAPPTPASGTPTEGVRDTTSPVDLGSSPAAQRASDAGGAPTSPGEATTIVSPPSPASSSPVSGSPAFGRRTSQVESESDSTAPTHVVDNAAGYSSVAQPFAVDESRAPRDDAPPSPPVARTADVSPAGSPPPPLQRRTEATSHAPERASAARASGQPAPTPARDVASNVPPPAFVPGSGRAATTPPATGDSPLVFRSVASEDAETQLPDGFVATESRTSPEGLADIAQRAESVASAIPGSTAPIAQSAPSPSPSLVLRRYDDTRPWPSEQAPSAFATTSPLIHEPAVSWSAESFTDLPLAGSRSQQSWPGTETSASSGTGRGPVQRAIVETTSDSLEMPLVGPPPTPRAAESAIQRAPGTEAYAEISNISEPRVMRAVTIDDDATSAKEDAEKLDQLTERVWQRIRRRLRIERERSRGIV